MKVAVARDGAIGFAEAADPAPAAGEALVEVQAIGLNRGDLRMAATLKSGARLGWDFAGVVLKAARGTPAEGVRVAGLLPRMGAWSERIAAPADCLAPLADGIDIATAAALPSAGLTALYLLEDAGALIGRRVLVTGASGGVGHLACQLARTGGAEVAGLVRAPSPLLDRLGIVQVAEPSARYDLILDSVGGETLAAAVGALAPGGLCLTFGTTGGRDTTFDGFALYQHQRRIDGFGLFPAIAAGRSIRAGLERLLALVAERRLEVAIGHRGGWDELGDAAAALADRRFQGKAVLTR